MSRANSTNRSWKGEFARLPTFRSFVYLLERDALPFYFFWPIGPSLVFFVAISGAICSCAGMVLDGPLQSADDRLRAVAGDWNDHRRIRQEPRYGERRRVHRQWMQLERHRGGLLVQTIAERHRCL